MQTVLMTYNGMILNKITKNSKRPPGSGTDAGA